MLTITRTFWGFFIGMMTLSIIGGMMGKLGWLAITGIIIFLIIMGYWRFRSIFSRIDWIEVNAKLISSNPKGIKGRDEHSRGSVYYTLELQLIYDWQSIEYYKEIELGTFPTESSALDYSENLSPNQFFKLLVNPNNPKKSIEYKGIKNTDLSNLKFIGGFLVSYFLAMLIMFSIYPSNILFFAFGIIPILLFLKLNNYVTQEISSNEVWSQIIGLNLYLG